jgi:hypothetical protein
MHCRDSVLHPLPWDLSPAESELDWNPCHSYLLQICELILVHNYLRAELLVANVSSYRTLVRAVGL